LPLTPVETPNLDAYFIELATYQFNVGLDVGDEFEITNWGLGINGQLVINATAGIVKKTINVIPGERDNSGEVRDIFQISLYAEITDKERLDEICKSFKRLNPGMFLEG
jgi:hypothetical protein